MRDRVFLIAYHRGLGAVVHFGKATHSMAVPAGYGSTRTVRLRHVDLLEGGILSQGGGRLYLGLPRPRNVRESNRRPASGLPRIFPWNTAPGRAPI